MGKNHHYVPRFLLRNFSLPGSEGNTIELMNLKTRLFHAPAPTKSQSSEDHFYGKDQGMESLLGELEGLASQIIKATIATSSVPDPLTTEWRTMVDFIAIQHGRTPAAMRQSNSFVTSIFRNMLHAGGIPKMPTLSPSAIDKIRLTHKSGALLTLDEAADLSPKLWDLADLLVVNECDANFVLPDVGVIFHNEWARESRDWGVTGYCCHGLQILCPLSPRVLWIKYDPDAYRIPQGRTVVSARKTEDVLKINRLAIAHAETNVYFPGDTATRTMLSQATELRAPRSESVRSKRLTRRGGKEVAVASHYELPNVAFDVPWMTLSPEAARIPVTQRAGMYRATSQDMPTIREYREGKRPGDVDAKEEEQHRLRDIILRGRTE